MAKFKPLFDTVRKMLGRGFRQSEVDALDLAIKQALEGACKELAPKNSFESALSAVLEMEGGYSNHKLDPGGRTNLGVTQRTWEGWVKRPATEAEMRRLTVDDVAPLYRRNYWDAVRGDDLPAGVALSVFDFGVNAGPSRAVRYLQIAVGALPDGRIGPKTLARVQDYIGREGQAALVREYADQRRSYYRQLGTFPVFGKGWLRRVAHIEAEALKLT